MWSNYPMRTFHRDLYAFQLSAYVQWRLDFQEGLLTRLHLKLLKDPNPYLEQYLEKLQVLSYDMLYGERAVWGGENPYAPKRLHMGTEPITLTGWETEGEVLLLKGENFTPCSKVFWNGQRQESWFLDAHTLLMTHFPPEPGELYVAQLTDSGAELSRTPAIGYAVGED